MTDREPERTYDPRPKRRRMGATSKVVVTLAVLIAAGIIGYPLLRDAGLTRSIETSRTQEFQDPADGDGIGRITIEDQPRVPAQVTQQFDLGPIEQELNAQREDLEAQNRQLSANVEELQRQLQDLANNTDGSDIAGQAQLAEALQAVQAQNAELIRQLQADFENRLAQADIENQRRLSDERAAREEAALAAEALRAEADERAQLADDRQSQLTEQMMELQRTNEALSQQISDGMNQALQEQSEQMRLADLEREERARQSQLEAERRAQLEQRRQEADALREAQIRSDSVVFDFGGSVSQESNGATSPATTASTPGQAARNFVLDGAPEVQVTTAEIIANPSKTVLQGTIIRATLETAINSSLPGQLAAIVNEPVYSFDQSQILVPQGSRLFGNYSSDVSLGQKRILVGWTRLVTPEGQSVQLAAFGADSQGRSGLTGDVNNRFGLRFGSAALLSIIGAGPSLAAASSDNPASADAAERIAENFEETTNGVIGEYATLPPIITVQPGASLTVIADRDLEFF